MRDLINLEEAILLNPITELRKRIGYSQAQLADVLHVSQSAVSQWELGITIPKTRRAVQLAEILGCSVGELLSSEGRVRDDD